MAAPLAWEPEGPSRKPTIVGIGAQKAGTSWLSQMLSQHPQVWATPFKEIHFFNHLYIPGHRYWIRWHYRQKPAEIRARFERRGEPIPPAMNAYIDRVANSKHMYTRPWYRWIFHPAPKGTQPMDFTPEYSTIPEEGVQFMAEWLPKARFLYLIRDPADRAASQLRMNLDREKRRPATLDDWMEEVANPVLDERGDYAAYLPRWQKHAGDRLLVLPYGRIKADPLGLLGDVERFCGLVNWDYRNPRTVVFRGPQEITLPEPAMAALRARLAPQYDYLRETFGPAFLEAIR